MDANDIEGAWALRLYHKPFIRWIWLGGLFMMLGGFVAAGERRFRAKRVVAAAPVTGTVESPS
jgi:cytochrome c-type biogenesis protein CcmF